MWVILRQITQFSKTIFGHHLNLFYKIHTNTSLWKTNSCKILGPNSPYIFWDIGPSKKERGHLFYPRDSQNWVVVLNVCISALNRDLKLDFYIILSCV